MGKPVVFISSTCEDLKATGYREAAKEAALGAGFYPERMEYWGAKDNPPLTECLARVAKADVLVVIVAYRFGWVPGDQPETDPKERKSMTWLSRSREKRAGRLPADVCINRLQELALAMQTHPEGCQVKVPRRWAAEQIAPEWPAGPEQSERQRIQTAETFLTEEELDRGIVVGRDDDIRFWHLTFQEFLAARAIAARTEQEQNPVLLGPPGPPNLYLAPWREVVLLLAGVLYKQGRC